MQSYFNDYENHQFEYIYFSAIAKFRGEDVVRRHEVYIDALKTENIKIVLGKFKKKEISRCKECEKCVNCKNRPDRTKLEKHEEKNTDVNIAITLVEKAILGEYDRCYILSSDSDFDTAIARALQLNPNGKITLVPPPLVENQNRRGRYYIQGVKRLTNTKPLFVSWKTIKNSQFPDKFSELENPWKI